LQCVQPDVVLAEARRQFPDGYRGDEIDKSMAQSFLTFLENRNGNLHVWDAAGKLLWTRNVPSSLLSKGDWDGDGVEDIACFALGANVDGMFSAWNGKGQRLYAISFLDSNGRADFIMPFGARHWGSDSILFMMEGH